VQKKLNLKFICRASVSVNIERAAVIEESSAFAQSANGRV
jgi:hypothetical protein